MSRRRYDRRQPEGSYLKSSIVILVIGIALAYSTFHWVSNEQTTHGLDQFKGRAQQVGSALELNLQHSEDALHAIKALFTSTDNVTREKFQTFVALHIRDDRSIQALEWVPRVRRDERAQYEAAAQRDGLEGYAFRQLGENGMIVAEPRDEYFPVFFVEPAEGNEMALGFDLGSSAPRRTALEQARDTGATIASARITLVQESAQQAGVLVFVPTYARGTQPQSPEARKDALNGFALGVFRVGDLLIKSTNEADIGSDTIVAVFDPQDTDNPAPLHAVGIEDTSEWPLADQLRRGPYFERSIEFGQREWLLIVAPRSGVISSKLPWVPWIASGVMLLLVLLVGFYIRLSVRRRNFAEELVQERTHELATSEERVRLVVENIIDGIITIDQKGEIRSINPAVEKIFGYDSEALIGQNVKMLMPEPYHSAHDNYLSQYLTTGTAKIIGMGREVEGLRANGSSFPLDLAVAEADVQGERLFVGIIRDISERKAMEKLKTEFVSTVSHELRTPLTAIRGALGLISSGATGALQEKTHEMVALAEKNSGRLISLVNDILDLEKIQSGAMEFHFHRINAQELLENSVQMNEPFAHEHSVRLEIGVSEENMFIRGDDERLGQVLANLISNAVKFSPEDGVVTLKASTVNGMVRLSVADNGPGIAEEFHASIFDRFRQVDSSDSREKGGTGLGLSICKSILEKHGGRIDLDSELGKGSVFFFDLPMISQTDSQQTVSLPQTSNAEATDKAEPKGIRVLVLEDDADVAGYLGIVLENEGYEFEIATTASQALEMIEHGNFQIVTVDIRLPDNQSADIIQKIRAIRSAEELSIVVVSGGADQACEEILANTVSVTEWLKKPFDQIDYLNAVERGSVSVSNTPKNKPRILYVEDDPAMPVFVAELLGDKAQISVAQTLADARGKLDQPDYDLVLLDIKLPDGSGYDLIDDLEERNSPLPVVIFSVDDARADIANKVKGVVVKSRATNQELLKTIEDALG